jgi:hypothetical protein
LSVLNGSLKNDGAGYVTLGGYVVLFDSVVTASELVSVP